MANATQCDTYMPQKGGECGKKWPVLYMYLPAAEASGFVPSPLGFAWLTFGIYSVSLDKMLTFLFFPIFKPEFYCSFDAAQLRISLLRIFLYIILTACIAPA